MPEAASRTPARQGLAGHEDVALLEWNLWRGYGRQAATALEALRIDPRTTIADAVTAARALARYSAARLEYDRTLDLLSFIRRLDPTYKRNARILEIHCLLQQDRTGEARELIERTIRDGHPADGCMHAALASASLIDADNNRLPRAEAVRQYLEYMSRPLRAGGHVGVKLRDPDKPLGLNNLAPETEPPVPASMSAKVSVLMAVHNGANVIEYAIRSVLEQSWRNLELVIVDDASTDKSWTIIQRLAKEDSRIIPVRQSRNAGPYVARNMALEKASGDYVTVNDADDWAHPQKIEAQVTHLLRYPKVISNMAFRVRTGSDMRAIPRLDGGHMPLISNDYSSVMVGRERALAMGGWDPVRFSADAEFVERLIALNGPRGLQRIRGGMPLSFSLWGDNNLTTSGATSIWTNAFGARHEYMRQFREWHRSEKSLVIRRTSQQRPFPVPGISWFPRGTEQQLDIVLITSAGSFNENARLGRYLNECKWRNLRAGVLLWPRFDRIDDSEARLDLARLSRKYGAVPVVHGDRVRCRLLLAILPEYMQEIPDRLPELASRKVSVVVNDGIAAGTADRAGRILHELLGKTAEFRRYEEVSRLLKRTFPWKWVRHGVKSRLRRMGLRK